MSRIAQIGGEPHWVYPAFGLGEGLSSISPKRRVQPRLPVGVARIERVELTCTPGRRVCPSVLPATIAGVDTPGS